MTGGRDLRKRMGYPSFEKMDDREIFRALRKLAREVGFNVKRTRGGYTLLERGVVVAGAREPLDLKHLAREMQRRNIISYEGGDTASLTTPARVVQG